MTGPLPDSLVSAPGVRDLSGTVTLPDVSTGQHLLALLPQAVLVLLVTAGAVLLFQVVRALRRGDVFEPASVARLRALALLIIIGGTAAQWIHDLTRNELLADAPLPGEAPIVFELSFLPMMVGLLVAFLSEVYARGAALRADVEGMV